MRKSQNLNLDQIIADTGNTVCEDNKQEKKKKIDHLVHFRTNNYQIKLSKFDNKIPSTVCYLNAASQVFYVLPNFQNGCFSY